MIVVSDTSPISNLIELGCIDLLPTLFTRVIIPHSVSIELASHPSLAFQSSYSALKGQNWLEVQNIEGDDIIEEFTVFE